MKFYNLILIASVLFFTIISNAHEKKHREHSAHRHGSGSLGISFDNKVGQIELKIPSESIVGFEHRPNTKKQKEKAKTQLALLENKILEIVAFDPVLNCKVTKTNVFMDFSSKNKNHSEVIAKFDLNCELSPLKSKLSFNVQKFFPKIIELDVQILVDQLQKSIEITKNGQSIDLI